MAQTILIHSVYVNVNFFIIDWFYEVYIIVAMSSVFEMCFVLQLRILISLLNSRSRIVISFDADK